MKTRLWKTWRCSFSRIRESCLWNELEAENAKLKKELHNLIFLTRRSAEICIFEYIKLFYNRSRQHSYLNYSTPVSFEKNFFKKKMRDYA
ncbi:IS3 family transposase [bacterium]|nr:IS3 family transposase [bacterium]